MNYPPSEREARDRRIQAFAQFEGCEYDEAEGYQSIHDEKRFEVGQREYLVVTDDEADDAAKEDIRESLWAFNASFILEHAGIEIDERVEASLRKMQEELCESANPLIEAMIGDVDEFADAAMSADGRGHFLSGYDGNENEETVDGEDFYIHLGANQDHRRRALQA